MVSYALLSRRKLLTQSAAVGAAAAVGLTSDAAVSAAPAVEAEADFTIQAEVTPRDVAILKFLAAAELIETDLWQQYAELAEGNSGFAEALEQIDDDLGIYTVDITEDELSHAKFINAFLETIGEQPVSLTQFATLQPPQVIGLEQVGRLTNLTHLTIEEVQPVELRPVVHVALFPSPSQRQHRAGGLRRQCSASADHTSSRAPPHLLSRRWWDSMAR